MNLPESMKAAAGRWVGTRYTPAVPPPREPLPAAQRCLDDPRSRGDGTGLWLPAGLVDLHDQVNLDGAWRTITGTDTRPPDYDQPGSAVLHWDGGSHETGFVTRVYVRDEATILGEQIRGGAA